MQMARWFGYRDGYQDLCRIWINAESADNYRFAADSIEELRTDLRLMHRQKLTPEDFGLAVRKHPGALLITARNKMKNAQQVSRTIGLAWPTPGDDDSAPRSRTEPRGSEMASRDNRY